MCLSVFVFAADLIQTEIETQNNKLISFYIVSVNTHPIIQRLFKGLYYLHLQRDKRLEEYAIHSPQISNNKKEI